MLCAQLLVSDKSRLLLATVPMYHGNVHLRQIDELARCWLHEIHRA